MKIINIVPGFGGAFYCGNCLRDSAYTQSLKKAGHDSVTIPLYLPLTINNHTDKNNMPVFYGAVNIYLEQKFKIFRHMPDWLHRFFNSPAILRYAAKKSGSTRADGLEEMTISMLKGAEGYQKDELKQLIDYLKNHEKPDVVHLSNALLIGLARKIKQELNIPVVCSLQDEDVWVDAMHEEYQEHMWNLMAERGKDVDAFVAVSNYFADLMKKKMQIPDDKMHTIYIGVEPENYEMSIPVENPPVIGYLSRLNEENGFEVLIDAFIKLKKMPGFQDAKLKATGGYTDDDRKFIKKQVKKLKKNGFAGNFEIIENFQLDHLKSFFSELSVLSVPVLKGEAFGLYQLESLASGVPIVQPALGAFPEIVKETGGGDTYYPNTPDALADKLYELLSQYHKIQDMSVSGRKAVVEKFNTSELTKKMIDVYSSLFDITSQGNTLFS